MTIRTMCSYAAVAVGVLAATIAGQSQAREALDGADPVMLVQGKDVMGKPEFKVVRRGFEYLFVSDDTKAIFERDPEKYEIQFGGLCARMGRTAMGNPSDYLVHEGRIYVFGSDECHRQFAADPAKYLPPLADTALTSADAERAGRALLDRVAEALGGRTFDAISTYVETATQIQKRTDGDVPVSSTMTWRFPDAVRSERTVAPRDRAMTIATVLRSNDAWSVVQGRTFPVVEEARRNLERDYGRRVVPLIRARNQAGFSAGSLGRATVAGAEVDRVKVRYGAIDAVVAVDPSTARIHAISFVDRSAQGQVGTYTVIYSDYRPVSGLTLPFRAQALFNDQPDWLESRTIDRIAVNTPVDPNLFDVQVGK